MANVSVEQSAVTKAILLCKQSIQQCQKSSTTLKKNIRRLVYHGKIKNIKSLAMCWEIVRKR